MLLEVRMSISNVLSQHPRPPCLPSLILSGRRLDIKVSLGMGSLHNDVIKLHKCFHKKCCERYTLRKQKRAILKFGSVLMENPANQLIYIPGGAGFLPTVSRISAPSTVVFHLGIHSVESIGNAHHGVSLKPPLNPSSFEKRRLAIVDPPSMVPWLWFFQVLHAEKKNIAKECLYLYHPNGLETLSYVELFHVMNQYPQLKFAHSPKSW